VRVTERDTVTVSDDVRSDDCDAVCVSVALWGGLRRFVLLCEADAVRSAELDVDSVSVRDADIDMDSANSQPAAVHDVPVPHTTALPNFAVVSSSPSKKLHVNLHGVAATAGTPEFTA
jgi:hypothetical protein